MVAQLQLPSRVSERRDSGKIEVVHKPVCSECVLHKISNSISTARFVFPKVG